MMSSTMPSAKYSCSGSELRLVKGSTAIEVCREAKDGSRLFHRTVSADRSRQRVSRFQHGSDETEALSRQCLDQALFLAGIADRAPRGIQARCQRCIGHAAPVPNGADEVVLADDALPVADQIIEQVEYLWRDGDDFRAAMQLAAVGVECVILEEIAQAAVPPDGPDRRGTQHRSQPKE